MFDKQHLSEIVREYKRDFAERWEQERYKWEAVKTFQDNWNVNAENFADMLARSFSGTYNLLASVNNFPAKMIEEFAEAAPEEVRAMFIALFDESTDVVERIAEFKNNSAVLLEKYGHGAVQHYQHENAVSTYLWLRYPDRYYIYKYSEVKAVAKELNNRYKFKKGAYIENLRNFYSLYNEICAYIRTDAELSELLRSVLTDDCYPDPEFKTLTVDVGFYISRDYSQKKSASEQEWFPSDYSPEISADTWAALLQDSEVFTKSSLEIMKRIKDCGGSATCSQLAAKYGEAANFYNSGSTALARRAAEKTGCPVMSGDDGNTVWWPILYVGKNADKSDEGVFIWKLREELSLALDKLDLSDVELYASAEESERRYWWLNVNPKIWSVANVRVGETQSYTLYNRNGNKRRIFQNFLDVRAGDAVIGYESNPVKQIVALCKITAEQDGEKIQFEKTEGLISPIDYAALKSIPELEKTEFFTNPNGSLFKLTKGEYDIIMDVIREENPLPDEQHIPPYTKEDFLNEAFMSEQQYDTLAALLKYNKNVILQGAPGVGKTFTAKRLAYSIMGERDEERIGFVQFHQSYSYEDFVMGYKPSGSTFELKNGIFYRFCQKAENQPDKDFFFIIDEINRANLSRVFGELLMLIEKDYRGTSATLAYNGKRFSVPENLYIIGMMNTADRSLAMIDYALRRRFKFFEMTPGFDSQGFIQYQNKLNNETFNRLIEKIKDLNKEIAADRSLGKGFCIGHSYFSNWDECTDELMRMTVDFDIIPTLEEYWFDDAEKLRRWSNILHGVFQ